MKVYEVTLEVDEKWLKAIQELTEDVYDDEICAWKLLKERE